VGVVKNDDISWPGTVAAGWMCASVVRWRAEITLPLDVHYAAGGDVHVVSLSLSIMSVKAMVSLIQQNGVA